MEERDIDRHLRRASLLAMWAGAVSALVVLALLAAGFLLTLAHVFTPLTVIPPENMGAAQDIALAFGSFCAGALTTFVVGPLLRARFPVVK